MWQPGGPPVIEVAVRSAIWVWQSREVVEGLWNLREGSVDAARTLIGTVIARPRGFGNVRIDVEICG